MEKNGLSLEEAESLVGPGWTSLVWSAWELLNDSGGRLLDVGEYLGALTLKYELPPMSEKSRELALQFMEGLQRDSRSLCYTCGEFGQVVPLAGSWKSLCSQCFFAIARTTDEIVNRGYEDSLGVLKELDTERWGAHWDPDRERRDDEEDGIENEPWQ